MINKQIKKSLYSMVLAGIVALPCIAATQTSTYTTITEKPKVDYVYVSDQSIRNTFDDLIDDEGDLDDDVSFSVKDGVITLRGVVDTQSESTDAEEIAYKIEGVSHVVNKLISEEAALKDNMANVEYERRTTKTETKSMI